MFVQKCWVSLRQPNLQIGDRTHELFRLNYLKADKRSGQPVLCVAAFRGGLRLRDGILVTLKTGTYSETILRQLPDIQALATRGSINLSGESPFFEVNGDVRIGPLCRSGLH